jgi:NADH-quinone oxidoreductase subunit H
MPAGNEVSWPVALARIFILISKTMLVILFFMLVRWSWPRFRFDQLMNLAWKVMLPLGLVNLVAVASLIEYVHRRELEGLATSPWLVVGVGWGVALSGWILAGILAPLHTDNRPRLDALRPPEFEPEKVREHSAAIVGPSTFSR